MLLQLAGRCCSSTKYHVPQLSLAAASTMVGSLCFACWCYTAQLSCCCCKYHGWEPNFCLLVLHSPAELSCCKYHIWELVLCLLALRGLAELLLLLLRSADDDAMAGAGTQLRARSPTSTSVARKQAADHALAERRLEVEAERRRLVRTPGSLGCAACVH